MESQVGLKIDPDPFIELRKLQALVDEAIRNHKEQWALANEEKDGRKRLQMKKEIHKGQDEIYSHLENIIQEIRKIRNETK